jgi:hypothetical protein
MKPTVYECVLDELFPPFPEFPETRTFGILDAARDERIYLSVLRSDREWCCLYRGDAATTMAEVAPYLVELDPQSRFTRWLIEEGWGRSWGVFLNASVSMEALRNHLRRLTLVKLPDGRSVYFRYYDPRVLSVYLPTCTTEELAAVFGPIERLVMESGDGKGEITAYSSEGVGQTIVC